MFNVTKAQIGLYGLVGIRQPFDPTYQILDTENQASESGLYVDDIAPFKVRLLKDSQDYVGISDTNFNLFLKNLNYSAIANVLTKVFDSSDYIDRNVIFTNASPRVTLETTIPTGSVIGYEICPSNKKNLAFKITRVNCQFDFDLATQEVTFFLMNSNVSAPIFFEVITLSSSNQWVNLNWVVDSTMNDYKGDYYLLIAPKNGDRLQPWKRDFEDSNTENNLSELSLTRYSFGTTVSTFSIVDFDCSKGIELSENTGLNPDITVFEDYTDLILQNKFLFSKVVQLDFAISALLTVVTSIRSNRDERQGKEIIAMIMTYVNGVNAEGQFNQTGLRKVLAYEIESLRKEIHKIREGYVGGQIMVDTLS